MKNKYQLDELVLTKLEKSDRFNFYDFKVHVAVNGDLIEMPGMFSFYDENDIRSFADMLEMDFRILS